MCDFKKCFYGLHEYIRLKRKDSPVETGCIGKAALCDKCRQIELPEEVIEEIRKSPEENIIELGQIYGVPSCIVYLIWSNKF